MLIFYSGSQKGAALECAYLALWVSDADPVVLCVLSFPTKVMPIQRVWPDAVQPTN